ncbi:DUF3616 domain-containing protein [Rhizobium ruizarguesonis]|uniref:DUF3616 domain-containing protein n=1 Tax=Rhizobium ruizarguesonis TaxID=2081791 RepID=UPI001031F141|nr:DUF3616 domain-containing protein [Rhizobium ruizarguesonis]TAZ68224.1 DUF3616 domain-containing protein [Rhizobium ruizarguesonis]TAZ92254.1 DUF3616 domain-containing protein [Rhizobium ruizarguesonis]
MRCELFCAVPAAVLILLSEAPPAGSAPFRYEGVCEASAAAKLDETHFVVASDETEQLSIYEKGNPKPIGTFTHPDVTDIEAATRIDNAIFWLTSHSLNKDGEDKKKRKILFATKVANNSLSSSGSDFRTLRSRLASILGQDEGMLSKSLNIEGLAATSQGELLIGLRAPLDSAGKALVLKVDNPFGLVGDRGSTGKSSTNIAAVSHVDLNGRGVRSIESVGEGKLAFLIVGGSVEDAGLPPLLFWWDGAQGVSKGPEVSLTGLTPEAMIIWDEHHAQILGDNGDGCSDSGANPRWFPSIDVTF